LRRVVTRLIRNGASFLDLEQPDSKLTLWGEDRFFGREFMAWGEFGCLVYMLFSQELCLKNFVGLGLRRDICDRLIGISESEKAPAFVECAPENWVDVGGYYGHKLRQITERYKLNCHGLSLSIGGQDALDYTFLHKVKKFLKTHKVSVFSEHLSFSTVDNAHLHELFPLPFTREVVSHIVRRVREVQEILERRIALENVSYYTTDKFNEMDEATFINAVISEGDCNLLLDVNNVYVNSVNHNYNPYDFISSLQLERVTYIHMAGHEKRSPNLLIDTHGSTIVAPVYDLFRYACSKLLPVPVLLERDFNFEDFNSLLSEMKTLRYFTAEEWNFKNVA
jgi:uncharacterized protein